MENTVKTKSRKTINANALLDKAIAISDFEIIKTQKTIHIIPNFLLVQEKKTTQQFFLKQIEKKNILNLEEFVNELTDQMKIDHYNILKIHFYSEDKNKISIFYEKFEGEILKGYNGHDRKGLTEDKIFIIISQIVKIIDAFHKSDMQMKNLNSHNLLISQNGVIKYCGLASKNESSAANCCEYQAPECFHNNNCLKSDLWSLGIIAYELFFGTTPFDGMSTIKMLNSIAKFKLQCPKDSHSHPSELFLLFLSSLLERNIEKRLTIKNVIKSAWFQNSLSKLNTNINKIYDIDPNDANFNKYQPTSKINYSSSLKIDEKTDKNLNIHELDKKNQQKNILNGENTPMPIDLNRNFIINEASSKRDASKINFDKKKVNRNTLEKDNNTDVFSKNELNLQTKELRSDLLNSRETRSFTFNDNNTMRTSNFERSNKQSIQQMNKNDIILEILQRNSERLSFKTNPNSSFRDHEEEIGRNSKRESISQITAKFLETKESNNILGNSIKRFERKKETKESINLKSEENKSDNPSTQLPTPQLSRHDNTNKNDINNNSFSDIIKESCSFDENMKNGGFEFSIKRDEFTYYSDKIKNKSKIVANWNEPKVLKKNNILCFRGNNDVQEPNAFRRFLKNMGCF